LDQAFSSKQAATLCSSIVVAAPASVSRNSGCSWDGCRTSSLRTSIPTIIGLPDLYLTDGRTGAQDAFRVWAFWHENDDGAPQKAFDFDIRIRRDIDEKFVKEGIEVSNAINEGVIFQEGGVTVTAFHVDPPPHQSQHSATASTTPGRSVAMSGDTRFSENLIEHAKGVDLLIHEAIRSG
jgi:ribonuclease Z